MPSFCVKEEIGKRLPEDDHFQSYLSVMCCKFCREIDENNSLKNIDSTLKVIVAPLFCSLNHQENAIMRMIGCKILDDVASVFNEPENLEKEINAIFISIKKAIDEKSNFPLINCLKNVTVNSYIKVITNLIYQEFYDTAFSLALCFINANVCLNYHGFRFQPTFKTCEKPFIDIGTSLDEGITEYLTLEMSGAKEIRDAYYFEVKYFKSFLERLSNHKDEIISAYFKGEAIPLLFRLSKNCDKCLFYDLFFFTDSLQWKKAFQLIKDIEESLEC